MRGSVLQPDVKASRTAAEAGWHASRYNLMAHLPEGKNVVIANLFKGTCAAYSPIEMYLLSVLDEIDEHHPIIDRLAKRGVIARFDERAAIETMGRAACAAPHEVNLTICPTMGCNFDCPYCFEDHRRGRMSAEVQDDVVSLAERMLDASGTNKLSVTWFGGEPLLAPDIIEALSRRLMALVDERGGTYEATAITNGYLLTKENVDMLECAGVLGIQVTIDGMGATHDATRHLAGGGATFERIVDNLRRAGLPFKVDIRHNVHAGNFGEVNALRDHIAQLAAESGNDLRYYPSPVFGSAAADERGRQVNLLCSDDATAVGIERDTGRFRPARGHYCGAQSIWSVGIDELGNLQMCWESVDKLEESFGTAHDWDPHDPIVTARSPDNLTKYLNTACPVPDEECGECVWLPACAGGCPNRRLSGQRQCPSFKDAPEAYVLALYARAREMKGQA